jgi:hypothetical protein
LQPDRAQQLADHPGPLVLGCEASEAPPWSLDGEVYEISLPLPPEAARAELWREAVPQAPPHIVEHLARSYRLSPGEIFASAREVPHDSAPEAMSAGLKESVERRLRNDLGQVARRMSVGASWDDVVLAPDELERLWEFINRSRFAGTVYDGWGFARRLSYGMGRVALFSGEPGTGKTMLAGLVARSLGLELLAVDLSQVLSRWVGETEKQISRLLRGAERAHAVLLFDEADALFAKRVDVDSSNDRYANLAVNHLLHELEAYSGVAILTTNKEASLDPALERRLSLHLRLSAPDEAQRQLLWRSLLPPEAPLADDVDFAELARRWRLTGGYIKNVVLRAAFLAASLQLPISMSLLCRAATREMEDMGRVVQVTDEEELFTDQPEEEGDRDARS